jgi:Alginate export
VKLQDGEFDWSTPGNNLYGIYGGIEKLVPKATVEPYFLWRRQSALKTELGVPGISNFATVGIRWVGKLPANFDYGTEMDRQAGSLGSDTISAWAGHWVLGETLIMARFKPRFSLEYNYASGDRNPKDGTRGTFDQLYPTAHDKYGLADQVGWKNIRNARAGVDLKLAKKWGLTGRYDAWWLADPHDALYSAASTIVARDTTGTSGKFVGQEVDSVLAYTFSKYLQVSGGYGHIFPGTFLNHTTPGQSYNFPYAMSTLIF